MAKFSDWLNKMKEKSQSSKGLTKFSEWIVNHKIVIISIFVVLIVLAVVGNFFVQKESDVIAYLDNDTITKRGLATLQEEYNIIGDFSIGISYLSQEQVETIVNRFNNMEKNTPDDEKILNKLVWVGTFDSLSQLPATILTAEEVAEIQANLSKKFVIETQVGDETIKTYAISVYFTTPNSSDETAAMITRMENIVKKAVQGYIDAGECDAPSVEEAYAFTGSAQNSKSLLESSVGDMPKFVIIAVIAVFIILLFTTRSYLEPLIFLATLGISILLNMGSNIIAGRPMGTVSSITASCATILQLAVAMDYAIFLMHTYYEEKRTTLDPKQAMVQALPKTIKSVVASSLTTVGGFIALFFMKFGIGYDLGFVLAKGVLLSLITVICLQPVIILFFNKWIAKTEHKWKPLTPRLKFDSKIITKKGVCIPIIVVCVALLIPAAMFQSKVDLTFISVKEDNPNPTVAEQALESSSNQIIIMTPYLLGDNEPQYEFIEKAFRSGYVNASSYDANATYYTQNATTHKMEEATVTAETFDAEKHFVRDTSVNTISDVFSATTILTPEQYNKLWNSTGIYRPLIYQRFFQSFISNVDQKTVDEDTNVHYMLYTMTIVGEKEDVESFNTVTYLTNAASTTFDSEAYASTPVQMTGNVVAAKELSEVTPTDYKLVNILSVVIIFFILLFTFRSFFFSS